jgi:hypothetical protein
MEILLLSSEYIQFLVVNIKGNRLLGDVGVDGRIKLKWLQRK